MQYQIRQGTPNDYPGIVAILNAQQPDPITVEEYAKRMSMLSATDKFNRLVAETADGQIAGFGFGLSGFMHAPGVFQTRIRVAAAFQGQGIGTALNEALEHWCRSEGAARLESDVKESEPAAMAWAEHRGYIREHHVFESTLNLAEFDPTPFREAVTAAERSGIRFVPLAELGTDEATLRRYFEFHKALAADQPGWQGRGIPTFELYKQMVIDEPGFHPEARFVGVDGDRWVAIAELVFHPSGTLLNGFTAVDREYRGRGLALAGKVAALAWAKAQGHGLVRTGNHSANAPMLAVNRKLGYVPAPGFYTLGKAVQ